MTSDETTPRLAVLGAGVMGVGITATALGRGVPVVLIEIDERKRDRARGAVEQELRLARFMGVEPRAGAPAELLIGEAPADAVGVDAVIEAVTESREAKVKVLSEVTSAVAPGTLLVTNTSSIPVGEVTEGLARPEDVVGTHFMNPAYLIPTVEVVRGPRTGDTAMASLDRLLKALGLKGVHVADSPGFVTSRLLHRMINDAARVVEEGRATPHDVDLLMQDCLGHRTGPLRTADLIGLDNLIDSLRVLHERTGDDGFRPCDLLLRKVERGDHGRKSGRGFYDYRGVRS
ncbi:3-hydroxyacyl-CoA dehydrogenase family protein [Kitasatospora sp. NPDC059327]|uniref:3-hydroxyacyl-CoA dehydrogenase family protein n=1 Tax=Kitasatospora sp. NPDC059327 TaxID=3346803 RepID=UPI0036C829CD